MLSVLNRADRADPAEIVRKGTFHFWWCKRIKEILFNIFALEKKNYLNINVIFLKNYNNEFNIIDSINWVILIALDTKESLIIENFNLKCNLLIEKIKTNLNLNIKIYINSSYSRYFFVNCLLFIIYKEI